MRALTILSLPLLSLIAPVLSYGTGAPSAVCETMIPGHGFDPQTTPSPFKVVLDKTKLKVGSPLIITLTSKSGRDEFKGFLVRMNMTSGNKRMTEETSGEFSAEDENSQSVACDGTPNLAMTHKSPEGEKMVKVKWTPKYPGKYLVYSTFVKTGDVYWTAVPHDELIEVYGDSPQGSPAGSSNTEGEYDWNKLCSDMKLNSSLKPETVSSNPYKVMIGPVMMYGEKGKVKEVKHSENNYTTYPKGLLWINVTSEYATPVMRLFMQVRKSKNPSKAYGKFLIQKRSPPETKLVHCFGGKENAVIFMDPQMSKISDLSFQWEAPQDELGEFEVVATALGESDVFWDKVGSDPKSRIIKVEKMETFGKKKKSAASSNHHISIAFAGTFLSCALVYFLI